MPAQRRIAAPVCMCQWMFSVQTPIKLVHLKMDLSDSDLTHLLSFFLCVIYALLGFSQTVPYPLPYALNSGVGMGTIT